VRGWTPRTTGSSVFATTDCTRVEGAMVRRLALLGAAIHAVRAQMPPVPAAGTCGIGEDHVRRIADLSYF
jgi:hypothetical protein